MDKSEELKEIINRPGRAVITTHQKPDADALGSSLGMASYLRKKGHEVSVISPTDFPDFLNWMDRDNEVIIFSEKNQELSQKLIHEADLIFCLDFNSLHRINDVGDLRLFSRLRGRHGQMVLGAKRRRAGRLFLVIRRRRAAKDA